MANSELAWELFRQMLTIRRLEEGLLALHQKGVLFGTVHTCIGQEACAVGVVHALDKQRDVIWSNHRGHGHYLAYCDDVEGLLAEVMGKSGGVCGGVGGSQHLHRDNFYTNGVLGGTVACAVGAALAEKLQESGALAVVFLGDGAMGEGIVYESFNMASLWQLPVLFVLEHNQYAQSTPTKLEQAGDLLKRPLAFGIETAEVQAWDVLDVYQAACEAVGTIRKTSKPYFLALHTYRFAPHSKGDDHRVGEEIETYRRKDALKSLQTHLLEQDPQRLNEIERAVEQRFETATQNGLAMPFLPPEQFIGMETW